MWRFRKILWPSQNIWNLPPITRDKNLIYTCLVKTKWALLIRKKYNLNWISSWQLVLNIIKKVKWNSRKKTVTWVMTFSSFWEFNCWFKNRIHWCNLWNFRSNFIKLDSLKLFFSRKTDFYPPKKLQSKKTWSWINRNLKTLNGHWLTSTSLEFNFDTIFCGCSRVCET